MDNQDPGFGVIFAQLPGSDASIKPETIATAFEASINEVFGRRHLVKFEQKDDGTLDTCLKAFEPLNYEVCCAIEAVILKTTGETSEVLKFLAIFDYALFFNLKATGTKELMMSATQKSKLTSELTVVVASGDLTDKEVATIKLGSVVQLPTIASSHVEVRVNNKVAYRGEVVVIDNSFGVRITEVLRADGKKVA